MKGIGILVDGITRSIEEVGTDRRLETDVQRVVLPDLNTVLKKHGWLFNWKLELTYPGREVYKVTIRGDKIIQGLISLERAERHIEMPLIEAAPHNLGRKKRYIGVAGNLVAFACKKSYEAGYEGFLAFTAKTRLIQHYIDSMGAELLIRNRMSISGKSAKKLVNSYYKGYLHE